MGIIPSLLRTVLVALVGVAATVVAAVAAILGARSGPASPLLQRITRVWSGTWLAAAGVDLEVTGTENIDGRSSYVVVANHSSTLDIMACFRAIPLPIRFLAKKELFRIPLLSTAMRAIGIIEVDRQARVAIHEQINRRAQELVESGCSLIIFPEGTRSRDGTLGPFKKGAFTIALRSSLPILPVAIEGTHRAWPPGARLVRGGRVRLAIEPPIESAGMGIKDGGELRDRARDAIAKRLEHLAQS
ncbi:MAG: lysophospholipid acyltransferase family protein [Actinomycetota bacterium]